MEAEKQQRVTGSGHKSSLVEGAHSLRHREFLQLQCFLRAPLLGRCALRLHA